MALAIIILLWICAGILALMLFIAPLGIWYGISRLREEAETTNNLLRSILSALTNSPEKTQFNDPPDLSIQPSSDHGHPVYEINHP